jgi:hypothetical protein
MTIHYQYAGATIRDRAAALVAEHQVIVATDRPPVASGRGRSLWRPRS